MRVTASAFGRFGSATLLFVSLSLQLLGCGHADAPLGREVPEDIRGIEELAWALTPLANAPGFAEASGTLRVEVADGEIALISRDPGNNAILVNDVETPGATTAAVKLLEVVGSSGSNTVIFDFSRGVFEAGTVKGPGITLDWGGGADELKMMGSSTIADRISMGRDGGGVVAVGLNSDNYRDILFSNVGTLEVTVSLGGGNDNFDASSGRNGTGGAAYTGPLTVFGGAGSDLLTSGAGAATLNGNEGNDTLTAGTGNAVLHGDEGVDVLVGGAGDDTLNGGTENDNLTASPGTDTLNGDAGDDTLNAGASANGGDTFNGGAGIDLVSYAARSAAVTVSIGEGASDDGEQGEGDTVSDDVEAVRGGSGNDLLSGSSAKGQTFHGGLGNDTVTYADRTAVITVTMSGNAANDGEGPERDNVRDDVENLICPDAAYACNVTGNLLHNTFTSGGGDDSFNGGAGDDTVVIGAGRGADIITGGPGLDTVDYGDFGASIDIRMDGNASATPGTRIGGDVENLICPTASACTVMGNALPNYIVGSSQDDNISGGAGDDYIDGKMGNDVIDCGSGSDIVVDISGSATVCEL